jgi:glycosyltransferase involved in cell wall biosynthesis
MKALLVHEYYRSSSSSGEDRVFEREKELLQKNGLTVKALTFKNDLIGTKQGPSVLKTALYTPWSPTGKRMIREAVHDFRPDVVHFHNTFPVLSPSAVYQADKMGCATVQTLHNFRTVCAQAMLMQPGGICEKCIGQYPWPALAMKCYRNSLIATLPLVANIALHRFLRTWQNKVNRFIVLSEFNKKIFVRAGFPDKKIRVKPNFFEDKSQKIRFKPPKENSWLFIGRLKEEKGVHLLPEVWKRLGNNAPLLHIVGDGPCRNDIERKIIAHGLKKKIIMHGLCSSQKVNEMLNLSSLLVLPSIWYEGFPLVIGEAYAAGVPVAASKIGTPASVVIDRVTGIHFLPGDTDDMVKQLSLLIEQPDILQKMGRNARNEYENKYTSERNFSMLMNIYQEAIEENCSTNRNKRW